MRRFLVLLSLLWAGPALAAPDIILLIADDISPEQVTTYGENGAVSHHAQTNLDAIAAAGVTFNEVYSSSTCIPTRVELLTGRRVSHVGGGLYAGSGTDNPMPTRGALLPKLLQEAGYETNHVGKWQVGDNDKTQSPWTDATEDDCASDDNVYAPLRAGFDTSWSDFCNLHVLTTWPTDGHALWINGSLQPHQTGNYYEEGMKDRVVSLINGAGADPLFISWNSVNIHSPTHTPPDAYCPGADCVANCLGAMQCRVYALDLMIGEVMSAVTSGGRDTYLIVLGDNGAVSSNLLATGNWSAPSYSSENHGKNGPFRSGMRVPLLIRRINGSITEANEHSDALVEARDVLSTILELAGASAVDGSVSLVPQLSDVTAAHRSISMGVRYKATGDALVTVNNGSYILTLDNQADWGQGPLDDSQVYLHAFPSDQYLVTNLNDGSLSAAEQQAKDELLAFWYSEQWGDRTSWFDCSSGGPKNLLGGNGDTACWRPETLANEFSKPLVVSSCSGLQAFPADDLNEDGVRDGGSYFVESCPPGFAPSSTPLRNDDHARVCVVPPSLAGAGVWDVHRFYPENPAGTFPSMSQVVASGGGNGEDLTDGRLMVKCL